MQLHRRSMAKHLTPDSELETLSSEQKAWYRAFEIRFINSMGRDCLSDYGESYQAGLLKGKEERKAEGKSTRKRDLSKVYSMLDYLPAYTSFENALIECI